MVQFFSVNVYGQMDPNCGNGINDPCNRANATLEPCNGQLPPIPPAALSSAELFKFSLTVSIAGCVSCYQGLGIDITVVSFETFSNICLNKGYDVNNPFKAPGKTQATPAPKKDCNTPNDPCKAVNETLTICREEFSPPPKSTNSGSYSPNDPKLAPCMCNDKFYEQLKSYMMCFATPMNSITVAPLDKFKEECNKLGVTYGAPPSNKAGTDKFLLID
ncbi:4317_t:CDS:2 [Funneliformis caledonium]|uniref:4317_t:CDS:1 n=1 Tax=Funneliformis caledonium TaxID=1117310 RepID=A0A9N9CVK4_9GLOM|nr:4317_t:CDS:2 [Funneliformis caledonium]